MYLIENYRYNLSKGVSNVIDKVDFLDVFFLSKMRRIMDILIMCGDSSVDGVESVVILINGSEVISFIVLEGVFDV